MFFASAAGVMPCIASRTTSRASKLSILQFHAVGFDFTEIEDVVDQLEQMHGIVMDVADEALLRVVERTLALLFEKFGESDDGVQRSAELVAHAGEELAFQLVGVLDFAVAGFQFLVGFADLLFEARRSVTSRTMAITLKPSSMRMGLRLISTGNSAPSRCRADKASPWPMGRVPGCRRRPRDDGRAGPEERRAAVESTGRPISSSRE